MGRVACIDGAIVAPEDAKVSVYDRGFLYGDGVFETIRTYRGVPFALEEHVARLARSAARVAIDMPVSEAQMASEIQSAIAVAANPESYARAMITRGAGPVGLDPALAERPLRVILVEPLVLPPPAAYRDGVSAITIRTERASDAAHGAKVSNYLMSLLALRDAKAAGAHEAILIDAAGNVVEGTTSNVFVVRGGEVTTPPEAAGILAGITRAHLLAVAPGAGVAIHERAVTSAELLSADEVFLSSSIREILPVVRIDDRIVGAGVPGPVTRALHVAFRAHLGVADWPAPWA